MKKAEMIPWHRIEEKYADLFESGTGNEAKPARMAVGALIIKQETGLSEEGMVQAILENPYMQFFIGLHEFIMKAPFAAITMVHFRKGLTGDVMREINEMTFAPRWKENSQDDSKGGERAGATALHRTS